MIKRKGAESTMYKIYAVCASGIGTSLFARKLITESIKELGYDMEGVSISCIGLTEANGTETDVFITGSTIAANISERPGVEKVVVVNVINDKRGMKGALAPVLERAAAAGRVRKL